MLRRRLVRALLAATLLVLRPASAEEEPRIALEFRDAELAEVVRSIGRDTGRSFIFDERLQGRVTIAVPDRITHDEALQVLHAALRLRGFAAIATPGGPSRILPLAESYGLGPLRETPEAEREAAVATLVRVRHADPATVAAAVEPLVGANGTALVVEGSQSLVLATSESALRRLVDIVHALDRDEPLRLAVLRLRWRDAVEVGDLVAGVFGADAPGGSHVEIVSDARTNALVVEATPEDLAEIRSFVRGLDRPESGRGRVHVVRVRNVDPEDLAERLSEAARPARGAVGFDDGGDGGALPLAEGDWSIAVDRPTRSLLVVADPDTFAALADVIAQLDVSPPVVSVEVQVVELDTEDALDVAIDTRIVSEAKDPGDTASVVRTRTSDAVTQIIEDPDAAQGGGFLRFVKRDDVAALFARDAGMEARVILRPHLLVASGEEQEIFAGTNIPIPVGSSTSAAGGSPGGDTGGFVDPLTLRTNIERQDVGVRLRVKPTVGYEGGLRLELDVEATRVSETVRSGESTLGDVEEVGPTLLSRKLTSSLRLEDGEVALIGGRGQPQRTLVVSGVPFLQDIPFLGQFFRSTDETTLRSHLLVAVQARVLRSPDDLALDSIRRRLAFERSREGLRALEAETDAPWAVLVTTREARAEADAVAAALPAAGEVRVVGWETGGAPRFDVYLTGFREFPDACRAARALVAEGFLPEVLALPEASGE